MWRHECGCISGSTLLYIHAHTSVHPSRLFFDHPRNEWSNYRYQLFNYVYRLKRFYLQYDSHSICVMCVLQLLKHVNIFRYRLFLLETDN